MASSSIPASIDENDPATILASLCVNAPDAEARDLLRRYDHDKAYSKNITSLKAVKKDIIVRTAEYLNIETKNKDNENKEMKKDDIIHELICRIQNLLPDECQICNKSYKSNIEDPPYLSCDVCGQEVHKPCFMKLLKITDSSELPNLNPHNLPGIHYFCKECEKEVSRLLEIKFLDNRRKVVIACENKNLDESHKQSTDIEYDEGIIHSSQVPSSSANSISSILETQAETPPCPISTTPIPFVVNLDNPSNKNTSPKEINSTPSNNTKQTTLSGKHKMGTNPTKPDSVKVEKSSKTCAYYTRNECKFGTNGKDCPFNHPEPCKQLILFGTKQPSGCNKGKKCKDFHPKMCPSSISKKECFNHGCHLTHIKGTTRKPKKTILEKDSNKQDQK